MEDCILTIEIKNKNPVALTDLTMSLLSLAQQYQKFLEREGYAHLRDTADLYVKEIRSGSIIVELSSFVSSVAPLISDYNTICVFAEKFSKVFDYLLKKIAGKPFDFDRKDLEQIADTINPVANDSGSQVNFIATKGGKQVINYTVNYLEANAIQNTIRKELENLKEPITSFYHKKMLVWYQAKFDKNSTTGDKAIIEDIYKYPLKIVFDNDAIKQSIMSYNTKFNKPWQDLAYFVDVEVSTLEGKPKAYKVLKYYPEDTFDPNE